MFPKHLIVSNKLFIAKQSVYGSSFLVLKPRRQGFENCQVITSDKSNLLRKVEFLLESDFQILAFFLLEVGYFIIVINLVYK